MVKPNVDKPIIAYFFTKLMARKCVREIYYYENLVKYANNPASFPFLWENSHVEFSRFRASIIYNVY